MVEVPSPTPEQVEARVRADFPEASVPGILKLLADCGEAFAPNREFLQLAVLRMANGDVEQVKHYVRETQMDPRDVLAPLHEVYGVEWWKGYVIG